MSRITLTDRLNKKAERHALRKKLKKMTPTELDTYFQMKYFSDLLPHMFSTGDLVLCRGMEGFSRLIQKSTGCTFSHISMLVVNPPPEIKQKYGQDPNSAETVYIFESDTETADGRQGGGVQLVPFADWLKNCERECGTEVLVVWRKLECPELSKETFPESLREWLTEIAGHSYKTSKRQLVRSAFKANTAEDQQSVFCSELVALTYRKMGILSDKVFANNYTPRDFTSEQRKDGLDLPLLRNARLSKEIRLRFTKPEINALHSIQTLSTVHQTMMNNTNACYQTAQHEPPHHHKLSGGLQFTLSGDSGPKQPLQQVHYLPHTSASCPSIVRNS